jgi:phenylacetic acid degradation operon negative regulatory protein
MARDTETAAIIDGVLKVIATSGALGCLVVAPNAAQIGGAILNRLEKRSRTRNSQGLVKYMSAQGLVTYRLLSDGDYEITITEKGKKRLKKSEFDRLAVKHQEKWDGKWRLVLFDVPEVRHKSRRAFSYKLQLLGFYQLQKSAWIIPYPCEKEVELIRQVFEVKPQDVILTEVTSLNCENLLRRHFQLV